MVRDKKVRKRRERRESVLLASEEYFVRLKMSA